MHLPVPAPFSICVDSLPVGHVADDVHAVLYSIPAGKMRHPGSKTLWGVLRCKDPGFVDLLEGCLRWDPAERMTPEEAMNHPWMAEAREQQQAGGYRCVER